jgi:hypothetical protein
MSVTKIHNGPQTWADSLDKQPQQWNMDMRFGIWNIRIFDRILYEVDSSGIA